MKACYEAGTLRAYLDDELTTQEMDAIADHLAACAACETQLAELRALNERVERSMLAVATLDAEPDVDAALARVRSRLANAPERSVGPLRLPIGGRNRRRSAYAAAVAAALLLTLLVPTVRTAADSLLQVFRGQSVIVVSVPQNRVQQIQHLNVDANSLFLSKPTEVGTAPAPQQVSSPAQATSLLGFAPSAPGGFPSTPTATTFTVQGQTAYQLQVNVQALRVILLQLGVTDVTIPDALGAHPISIVLPAAIQMQYQGSGYSVTLIEGTSPIVNLPPGVDLSLLGKAVLEVFGMSPAQAATLSKQIDWRSTIVFPFPLGTTRLQQVTIGGANGVMLNAGAGSNGDGSGLIHSSACQAPCATPGSGGNQGQPNASASGGAHTLIYWQKGTRFYILDAQGSLSKPEALAIANTVA